MVGAMSRSASSESWRRSPAGATASARLLRWPARNYFAELEPRLKEGHPVDDLMAKDPDIRRIRRRAHRHFARAQTKADSSAVLDFEAERNHLDSARVEAAYNIGYEGGLVAGMIAGLTKARGHRRDRAEAALLRDIRSLIAGAAASRGEVQALLLEMAWSLALESPAVRSPARSVPRNRSRPGRGQGQA